MNRQRVLIGDHHNAQLSKDVDTKTVLCVDLDGTLLSTDILWESILLLLKKRPWKIINFPFWLLRGKAYLKRQVAQRVELCAASLPIRQEVLKFRVKQVFWRDDLPDFAALEHSVLPFAYGRTYGDSCLNEGGILWRPIMFLVKSIPESVFKRMDL